VLRKALNQGVSSSKLSGGSQERFNETEDLEGEQVRGEMTTDLPVSQDGLPVLLVNDEPFSPEEAEFFIEYAAQEELEILREGGYDLRQRT